MALSRLEYQSDDAILTYHSDKPTGPTGGSETLDVLEFLASGPEVSVEVSVNPVRKRLQVLQQRTRCEEMRNRFATPNASRLSLFGPRLSLTAVTTISSTCGERTSYNQRASVPSSQAQMPRARNAAEHLDERLRVRLHHVRPQSLPTRPGHPERAA